MVWLTQVLRGVRVAPGRAVPGHAPLHQIWGAAATGVHYSNSIKTQTVTLVF